MTISYFVNVPVFKSTAFVVWILPRSGRRGIYPLPRCFNTTSEPPCAIGLRLQEFDFKLEYELGLNNNADVLSKKAFFDTTKINEAEHFVNYAVSNSIPKTLTFHEIREAT